MAIHDRAYTRAKSWSKAIRKYHIDRDISGEKYLMYNNLHQYADNKIFCSCPLCSAKTKNKGRRRLGAGGWAPSYNPTITDKRKQDKMDFQMEELEAEEND